MSNSIQNPDSDARKNLCQLIQLPFGSSVEDINQRIEELNGALEMGELVTFSAKMGGCFLSEDEMKICRWLNISPQEYGAAGRESDALLALSADAPNRHGFNLTSDEASICRQLNISPQEFLR